MLNWSLLKEPENWVIVTLMSLLGMLLIKYITVSAKGN